LAKSSVNTKSYPYNGHVRIFVVHQNSNYLLDLVEIRLRMTKWNIFLLAKWSVGMNIVTKSVIVSSLIIFALNSANGQTPEVVDLLRIDDLVQNTYLEVGGTVVGDGHSEFASDFANEYSATLLDETVYGVAHAGDSTLNMLLGGYAECTMAKNQSGTVAEVESNCISTVSSLSEINGGEVYWESVFSSNTNAVFEVQDDGLGNPEQVMLRISFSVSQSGTNEDRYTNNSSYTSYGGSSTYFDFNDDGFPEAWVTTHSDGTYSARLTFEDKTYTDIVGQPITANMVLTASYPAETDDIFEIATGTGGGAYAEAYDGYGEGGIITVTGMATVIAEIVEEE